MPGMIYICKQGDVLDAICYQHYGTEHGTTELVLNGNPSLCSYGTHLPHGLVIELPLLNTNPETFAQQVSLWE